MVSVREGGLLVRWCCRVRTKEDEKKGEKKEEQRKCSGAAKKTREKDFGWGTCLLMGKGLMSHPFNFLKFTYHLLERPNQ